MQMRSRLRFFAPRSWKIRLLLGIFLLFFIVEYLDARPGGGSSSRSRSSGGSSRSSSGGGSRSSFGGGGGGGGSGSMPPEVAIIIVIAFVGFAIVSHFVQKGKDDNNNVVTSSGNAPDRDDLMKIRRTAMRKLAALRERDPNFSETLFLDYAQNVFHQYYSALGGDDGMQQLRPFFFNAPSNPNNHRYTEIVINAMYITHVADVTLGGVEYERIHVMMETNFTEIAKSNNARSRYLSEQEWSFVRRKGSPSLPPAKMQALACPSCGAPESFHEGLSCRACGTIAEPAALQWAVILHRTLYEEKYTQNELVTYEEEVGTENATIFDPQLGEQTHQFAQAHGLSDFGAYFESFKSEITIPAFRAIYAAWTNRDLSRVRHLMSDFLYQTQQFWIDEYKAQGIKNYLDDIHIGKIMLARIDTDKYYEAFTVRIFADCKTYVLRDTDQKLLGGNKNKARYFSEYWTFVRRTGTERPAKDSLDLDACPSCSAPLDKMGMTGTCGYCSHKISTGEFSWVLSRITQDEAYC